MTEHTTEPWTYHETEIGDARVVAGGMQVAICATHDPFGQDAINARRIAACVNYCEGATTEWIEAAVVRRKEAREAVRR